MDVDKLLGAARQIIERAQLCFMVSGQHGEDLHARMMHPYPPDEDFTVWLGTSPRCRKVDEVRAGGSVLLAYSDLATGAYVTVTGNASLTSDPALLRRYWREEFRQWWPDGPEGGDYLLIRLQLRRIELVSGAEKVEPEPKGLCAAVLVRREGTWHASTTLPERG